MSEPMTDLDWWAATRYPSAEDDWAPVAPADRHAFNEVAAETPIFHALSTGAWRSKQPAAQQPRHVEPARAAQPARPAPPARSVPPARSAPSRSVQPARPVSPARPEPLRAVPDPVEAFRRDPLTMPIPKLPAAATASSAYTAYAEVARRAAFGAGGRSAHALPPERTARPERREVSDSGRHHRRRPSISSLL